MGTIAAAILNPQRRRGSPALKPSDFMLKPPQTKRQKEQGLKSALRRAGKARARKDAR